MSRLDDLIKATKNTVPKGGASACALRKVNVTCPTQVQVCEHCIFLRPVAYVPNVIQLKEVLTYE